MMAPVQVCQAQFSGRLQGRGPSGKGRVKSAFQLPSKKGGGGREREEEKQTWSVSRRHKARYTKGAREGRRGLPGARLIPTPARGLREECGRRIPPLGPAGESFPRPGWVSGSAAPHPEGRGPGRPPQRGKEGLDVRGRYALRPFSPYAHPHSSPGDAFYASPAPEEAPGAPRRSPDTLSAAPASKFRQAGPRGGWVLPFPCARLRSSSARRASKVTSASPKPARHGSEAARGSQ